jgi:heme/copper-type cytochrome/quinol oxidase subunit 2
MTNFLQLVSILKGQMNATLSRSDVLKPLAWLIGILATLTVAAAIGKSPTWLLVIFAAFMAMSVCLYIGAYVYCLVHDRDSLRSETYSLHKMAIEHGVYGDSRIGLQEPGRSLLVDQGQKQVTTSEGGDT